MSASLEHSSSTADDSSAALQLRGQHDRSTKAAASSSGSDMSAWKFNRARQEVEVIQVGTETCEVPAELLELSDLKGILSLEAWNNNLTDDDRLHLLQYLPPFGEDQLRRTLFEVLGGRSTSFGSPLQHFGEKVLGGHCEPRLAQYNQGLLFLQRREYLHRLRDYHNKMVNGLLEMKRLWQMFPEANLEDKLELWQQHKASLSSKKPGALVKEKVQNRSPSPLPGAKKVKKPKEELEDGTDRKRKKLKKKQGDKEGTPDSTKPIQPVPQETTQKKAPPAKRAKAVKVEQQEAVIVINQVPPAEPAPPPEPQEDTPPKPEGKQKSTPLPKKVPGRNGEAGFSARCLLGALRGALLSTEEGLTVQEVEARLRQHPGDPRLLEGRAPLAELIRTALKAMRTKPASKAPKNWLPAVTLDKDSKRWAWVGGPKQLGKEDLTKPFLEDWGLPETVIQAMERSFLDRMGYSGDTPLPAAQEPPLPAQLSEADRFVQTKNQKSQVTINVSSPSLLHFYRKEEAERYAVPNQAYAYTALDGCKSTVAPMRRGAGKSTAKARDHPMLKQGRPPHVTILCLVRDAAARLPGAIGTRADVCALIRLSQFIVEDTPENQINQVVSGALDRLHYERDPCVRYDSERKLWVYLHRDRTDADFDKDGCMSIRRAKPKAQGGEQQEDGGPTPVKEEARPQEETAPSGRSHGQASAPHHVSRDMEAEQAGKANEDTEDEREGTQGEGSDLLDYGRGPTGAGYAQGVVLEYATGSNTPRAPRLQAQGLSGFTGVDWQHGSLGRSHAKDDSGSDDSKEINAMFEVDEEDDQS